MASSSGPFLSNISHLCLPRSVLGCEQTCYPAWYSCVCCFHIHSPLFFFFLNICLILWVWKIQSCLLFLLFLIRMAYKISSLFILLKIRGLTLIFLFSHFGGESQLFYSQLTTVQAIISHSILELVECCKIEIRRFFSLSLGKWSHYSWF